MTIQRGIDPRDFALLSFGGAGPAQSPAVMELLGMKACIVPPNPGNLSAFGLLAVDWRTDQIVTKVMHEDADRSRGDRRRSMPGSSSDAVETLKRDGIERSRIRLVREADLRYAGQSMEVRVPAPGGAVDATFLAEPDRCLPCRAPAHLRLRLRRPAEDRAGQFLRLRLRPDRAAEPAEACRRAPARRPPARTMRPVYFDGAFRDTPIYDRAALPPGVAARRPCGGRGIRLDHGGVPRPDRWRSTATASW